MELREIPKDYQERLNSIKKQRLDTLKAIEILKAEYQDITRQIENSNDVNSYLNAAREKFNSDPKIGLEYLFEKELVSRTPIAVANFFVEEKEQLSKTSIGNYLGEVREDFNMQVLDEFVKLHNFKDRDFLPALRQFLLDFQLPGESQKIYRILSSFAEHYAHENPNVFQSQHDAFVLAYAAILLNTTLHNTNARHHNHGLAEERTFVRTMLKFDEETNLSEDLIRKVYHEIKTRKFEVVEKNPDPGCELMDGLMRGWLWKQSGRMRNWKRRWFVLTDDRLCYFTAPERPQRKRIIALENVNIRRAIDRTRNYCFELFTQRDQTINACKADREGVIITGHHSTYRLAAPSAREQEEWILALQKISDRFGNRRGASVPCFPDRPDSRVSSTRSFPMETSTSEANNRPVASTQQDEPALSLSRDKAGGSQPLIPFVRPIFE